MSAGRLAPIPDNTPVKVKGLRGTFRFHGPADGGDSCTVFGGTPGHERWRTVTRDRVRVDRKAMRRAAADASANAGVA